MGRIEIKASAITKDEQLDIARLLIKAGYTVSITKGKVVNGKGVSYIDYERRTANVAESIQGSGRDQQV